MENMKDKNRSSDLGIFSIILNSYQGYFSYVGAFFGGGYGVLKYVILASPGTESVLWAFAWILIGLLIGGTIGLLFFGLPQIAVHLFSNKGKVSKIIGLIVLTVFIGAVFLVYQIFTGTNKNIASQTNPIKPKMTTQEIINEINNDTKTKVYLPKGVQRSSLIPSEEESTKMRCESCATNLKPGSPVANNQSIISNCTPMIQKCNKIGITW